MQQESNGNGADRITRALEDYRASVSELRSVRARITRCDSMTLNEEVTLSGYEARSDMLREQLRRLLRAG